MSQVSCGQINIFQIFCSQFSLPSRPAPISSLAIIGYSLFAPSINIESVLFFFSFSTILSLIWYDLTRPRGKFNQTDSASRESAGSRSLFHREKSNTIFPACDSTVNRLKPFAVLDKKNISIFSSNWWEFLKRRHNYRSLKNEMQL